MEKRIALFDIDNTIYDGHIIFPLIEYQHESGIIERQYLKKIYKIYDLYKTGAIKYETAAVNLLNYWAKALKGLNYISVLKNTKEFFSGQGNKFYFFAQPLINFLKQKNYDVYFVTGTTQFVAQAVTEYFKTKDFFSSELALDKDIFTGRIKKNLADSGEKLEVVKKIKSQYNLKNSFAFGYSETDIKILKAVEFPITINPTPKLKLIAEKYNWRITEPEKIEELVSGLLSNRD